METDKVKRGVKLNHRYKIEEEIGSGGGGVVYRAFDENLQKTVVVKQIKDIIKSLDASRIEVDILKNIKHPYLPQVSDFFEEKNGEIYTVMEYIEGENLKDMIAEHGKFEKSQVLRWSEQLAGVVAYLHSQSPPIIHSDIKPENIIITKGAKDLCLIDFNISLAMKNGDERTIGVSAGYSPPEQYGISQGESQKTELLSETECIFLEKMPYAETELMEVSEEDDRTALLSGEFDKNARGPQTESPAMGIGARVDMRSDVYSVGATIYHMATGVCPPGDFSKIPSIRSYPLKLGEGLLVIIEKCMQLDPAGRYASGRELFDAIKNIRSLDADWNRYQRREWAGRILCTLLVAGGLCLVVGGQFLKKTEMDQAYQRSVQRTRELIENYQFDEAERELDQAFELYPDKIDAYVEKALAEYTSGNYETAIETALGYINQLGTVRSEHEMQELGDLYYILGNSYFECGQFDNGNNSFKKALDYNEKKNSLFYRDYAILLAKSGNIEEAEKQLEQAAAMNLSNDAILIAEAEILFSKGDYDSAIQMFQDAFRASGELSEKLRVVSLCDQAYVAKGREGVDDHIRFLENAVSTLGNTATVQVKELLAQAYLRKTSGEENQEDQERFQEYYWKAVDIYQSIYDGGYATANTLLNLGIIYESVDEYEKAGDIFEEYIERYPNHYQGYMYLAFLEAMVQQTKPNQSRDYQSMNRYYEKAMELYQAAGDQGDQNMEQLTRLIQDAKAQGWLD